jgi:TP901 family phage tail tape measure protein
MIDNNVNVKITADIANLQSGLNQAQNGLRSFGNVGTSVMGSLASIAGTVGVAMATNQMIENFKSWELGLIDIGTQLGKMRQGELPAFEEGIKNLSISSGASLDVLGKGMADIVDRGIEVGKELQALDRVNRLATSTNSAFGSSLNAVDVVMKQFGTSAGNFNQVIDKVFETTRQGTLDMGEFTTFIRRVGTVANGVGVQFDELAGILAFLTEKQVPARVAMQALTAVMTDLNNLSPERIALFKQEGIAIDANTVKEKGLGYAMAQLSNLSSEALQKIMPNIRNREVLTLITKNLGEVQSKTNEIMKSSGVVDEEFAKRQASLSQMTKQLSASFMVLGIEALTPLVPIIKNVVEKVTEIVKSIREWGQENPKLYANIVLVTGGLVALLTIASTAIIVLGSLAGAWGALGIAIASTGVKIASAFETMQIMALYASGPMIGAIVLLIGILAVLAKSFYDTWSAQQNLIKAQNQMAQVVSASVVHITKSLTDLQNKYTDLTDAEQERIAIVLEEAKAMKEKERLAMADKKITEEESKALSEGIILLGKHTQEVVKGIEGRKHLTVATQGISDAEEDMTVKMKASDIVAKEKEIKINAIIQKYLELAKQYDKGKISQEQFTKGMQDLVVQGSKVTGSVDEIITKMKEVNATNFTVSLMVRLEAEEVLVGIKERLLQAQEDLVLNQASGEERKRLQIEITEKRALRAIAVEMEAQMIKYNEAVRLIQLEGEADINNAKLLMGEKKMTEEQYKTYRRKLMDDDLAKQLAVNGETMKSFELLKQLAHSNAIAELNGNDERIDSNRALNDQYRERIDLLKTEQDVVLQGGAGATINLPEFQAGRRTTIKGGIGGLTINTLSGFSNPSPVTTPAPTSPTLATIVTPLVAVAQKILASGFTPTPFPTFKGYAEGTDYVPYTGLYQLHRGEKVVTREDNVAGGGGVTIVTLLDPKLVPEIMAQYPNAILNVVNADILRNGVTRRNIKSVNK